VHDLASLATGGTPRPQVQNHVSIEAGCSKSFPPQTFSFPTGLIPRTLGPSNDFTLLNGWSSLHGVLD